MRHYPLVIIIAVCLSSPVLSVGQTGNTASQLANLTEDFRLLKEETRSLSLEIEALRRENAQLKDQLAAYDGILSNHLSQMISRDQLDQAVKNLEERDEAVKDLIVSELTKQVNAMNRSLASDAKKKIEPDDFRTEFPKNYPQRGVSYTVKAGDTLSDIAVRLNSSVDWIQNANAIPSPRLLQVGKTYFVPQMAPEVTP